MSFILDALKKLERTRSRPSSANLDVPTIQSARVQRETTPRWLPWLAVSVLAFVAVGLGVWRYLEPVAADKPMKRIPKEHKVAVAPPPPTPLPTVSSTPSPTVIDASQQPTAVVAAVEQRPRTPILPAPKTVVPATVPPLPTLAPPRRSVSRDATPAENDQAPVVAVQRTGVVPRQRAERLAQRAPEEIRRPESEPMPESGEGSPENEETSSRSDSAGLEPPAVSINAADVPLLEQMSPEVQNAVPKMKISILAYATSAADRMAYINGHKYMEGQLIDGKVKVEAIARGGVVLNYQGQKFLIRP